MSTDDRGPIAYPRETILTTDRLAAWLQCSRSTVEAMELPRLRIPGRVVRYSAGHVLAFLEGRYRPPSAGPPL